MTTYKTATHQNIAVWARRLKVEVLDLDKAAAFADRLYGGPSRKGCLAVLAMKWVAVATDTIVVAPQNVAAGIAMSKVLYDSVYGDQKYRNVYDGFRDELAKLVDGKQCTQVQADQYFEVLKEIALDFVSKGQAARNSDHSSPSIARLIVNKARGH